MARTALTMVHHQSLMVKTAGSRKAIPAPSSPTKDTKLDDFETFSGANTLIQGCEIAHGLLVWLTMAIRCCATDKNATPERATQTCLGCD